MPAILRFLTIHIPGLIKVYHQSWPRYRDKRKYIYIMIIAAFHAISSLKIYYLKNTNYTLEWPIISYNWFILAPIIINWRQCYKKKIRILGPSYFEHQLITQLTKIDMNNPNCNM